MIGQLELCLIESGADQGYSHVDGADGNLDVA
jgi:hypothetical protein